MIKKRRLIALILGIFMLSGAASGCRHTDQDQSSSETASVYHVSSGSISGGYSESAIANTSDVSAFESVSDTGAQSQGGNTVSSKKSNVSNTSNTSETNTPDSSWISKLPSGKITDTTYTYYNIDFQQYLDREASFYAAMKSAVADATTMAAQKEKEANGKPFRVSINMKKAIYKTAMPIVLKNCKNIEINGNGSTIINTNLSSTFNMNNANNICLKNLSVDYDPLPFTQGVITKINSDGTVVDVKIDKGYPMDTNFAGKVTSGFFTVFDRKTQAPKVGARNFITPKSASVVSDGVLQIQLAWSGTESGCGPGQIPLAIGDVVAVKPHLSTAINVENSGNIEMNHVNLYASPGFGMNFVGGYGNARFDYLNVVPGPKPEGATQERLCSTNSDGTHFNSVQKGPVITNSNYKLTSDDPINIHNFYYFVVKKYDDKHYIVSPKWDVGLEQGDQIDTIKAESFASLGRTTIVSKSKKTMPELKSVIDKVWEGKSPTTLGATVYDITFKDAIKLEVGDAVSSLSRTGEGTIIKNSTFHGGGRVMIKSTNAVVENCKFSYSGFVALHIGSDIGFWAEASFAENVVIRNNTFSHCLVGANSFFSDSDAASAIYIGLTYPVGKPGLKENYGNQNILVEGNTIENSYGYAMQILNGNNIAVRNNTIGQTFIRGNAFRIGSKFYIPVDSAVLVAMSKNVAFSNNTIATNAIAQNKITVDVTCDQQSVSIK